MAHHGSCGHDEQEKGAMMARFARRACTGGTMSLRRRWWSAVREGQKEGSNGDRRARLALYTRTSSNQRGREWHDERRRASTASRSSRAVSRSPLFICEVHQNRNVREGEQTYWAP
jgi:hypothetical protein